MKKEAFENSVEEMLGNRNVQGAIDILDEHIKTAHRANKVRRNNDVVNNTLDFEAVNKAFGDYLKSLSNSDAEDETQILLERYIVERKKITKEAMKRDNDKWTEVCKNNDAKAFWKLVDWKGNMKRKKTLNSPSMKQFEIFFEDLYKCKNQRELQDIMELETDIEVPALDNPIGEEEIKPLSSQ